MTKWKYSSGENRNPSFVRVYRSDDGLVGKVVRTRLAIYSGKGSVTTRYFAWSLPDIAPEYETEDEARVAASAES